MFENYIAPSELCPSDPRFGCGPSLVPTEYLNSLAETGVHLMGTSHRKPGVKNLVKEIQEGLAKYFKIPADYEVLMGNGGATLLFDMIATGMVEKSVVHYTCGEFSKKWYKSSALVPWIEAKEVNVEMGKGISALDDSAADLICCTLNETSTGVMLDGVPEIGGDRLIAVDATSGAGQVPCDVSKVDAFFFSPQKVFASDGGLWVAILSPAAIKRVLDIEEKGDRYIPGIFSWKTAIDNSRKNQTYNTPSVATLYLLNEQVKRMNEVGYGEVIRGAQEKAKIVYDWAESKPYLSSFITEDQYKSVAVATIDVDDKVDVSALLSRLHNQQVVYGIESYRKLGRNQFRISLFHNIKKADVEKLVGLLSHAIESVL